MKQFLYTSLFLIITAHCFGQQHTNYTQYTLNRFALNPAVAGIKPCAVTSMGHKNQWIGFEGAPKLYFASFHTRLNKEVKFQKNIHGIGLFISNDRVGFSNTFSVKFAYAYHIKLWTNYHLSVGIYGGIQQQKFSTNEIRIAGINSDPAFDAQNQQAFIYPEVSPGGFIYNKNFYAGLSMFQIYPTRTGDIGTNDNKLTGHYFLMGGYRFRGKNLDYIPSLLLSFSPFISPTADFTLTLDFKQKLSIALGSKYLNSSYASIQFKLSRTIQLGYTYEYALNEISKVAPSSHEIILQFSTCSTDRREQKFFCPAYQ